MISLAFTLLLGMGNFAWHRAVIESGHRMMSEMRPESLRVLRFFSLLLEFALLYGALYAAWIGHTHWFWAYVIYSLVNGSAAWMIVKGRM